MSAMLLACFDLQIAKVTSNADVPVDAQSVAGFFSGGVCALRNADDGPTEDILCSACTVGCHSDLGMLLGLATPVCGAAKS